MTCKKLSISTTVIFFSSIFLIAFIYYQYHLWHPLVPFRSFAFILLLNGILAFPSAWLHETAHVEVIKRKGYSCDKKIGVILPHVRSLEPVLLKDYRECILAPFVQSLVFAIIVILIVIGLGPFLPPSITVFFTMRAVIQLYGCAMDLYWAWIVRSLPDSWWAADCGKFSYVCPTKEKAIEFLADK